LTWPSSILKTLLLVDLTLSMCMRLVASLAMLLCASCFANRPCAPWKWCDSSISSKDSDMSMSCPKTIWSTLPAFLPMLIFRWPNLSLPSTL
jgi:hypothetical protein